MDRASIECIWAPQFNRRHPGQYAQENKSRLRGIYEASNNRGNVIELFMKDSRDAERYSNQVDLVMRYCGNVDLSSLENANLEQIDEPLALLDDRKEDLYGAAGEDGLHRQQQGPLSSRQLYRELQKPRYRNAQTEVPDQTVATSSRSGFEPDAERRIIYVTDASPWAILAIVATASFSQAFFLRRFIYNYLSFTTSLSVTIPTGFPYYGLEFHLPFYSWRKGCLPMPDPRQNGSGHALRQYRCLKFFEDDSTRGAHLGHSSCKDHLYQAQVSFLVAGIDNSSYIGYCFVDTYHNGCDNDESVSNYDATTPSQALVMDPPSAGNLLATKPLWQPRLYFLRILEFRIEMVKDEWVNVVSMIEEKMYPFTHGRSLSTRIKKLETELRMQKLQRFYDWTQSTIRLLLDLIHTLSKTVDAWDEFCKYEIGYFLNDHAPQGAEISSVSIMATRKHVTEMRGLLKTLQNQKSLCNNIARELELHLALEDSKSTLIQLRTQENVKAITILAFLVSPPSVAAAIFSMNSDVLPITPSFGNYLLTTVILASIMLLLLRVIARWSWKKTARGLQSDSQEVSYPIFRRHLSHIPTMRGVTRLASRDSVYDNNMEMDHFEDSTLSEEIYGP